MSNVGIRVLTQILVTGFAVSAYQFHDGHETVDGLCDRARGWWQPPFRSALSHGNSAFVVMESTLSVSVDLWF